MSKQALWRAVLLGICGCAPWTATATQAAQAIQGAVGNVSAIDGANLGEVGCRVWSTSDPTVNANQALQDPSCVNNRCLKSYRANALLQPGGFICQGEGTAAYAQDADQQTFYQLIDGQVFGNTCNHIAFYAVQGLKGSSVESPSGDFRKAGCPGLSTVNCFERADSRTSRSTPLLNVQSGYGPTPHSIPSLGGMSPIPNVRVAAYGCNSPGLLRLTWEEPETYAAAMKDGVPSPVKGVRLYRHSSDPYDCPDAFTGWEPIGDFPYGAGATGTCIPATARFERFALTVRLVGPNAKNNPASEIETGHVQLEGFVGTNSQSFANATTDVRIAGLTARYAGRGTVSVRFATGHEGGIDSYVVTRSGSLDGPYARVSPPIVPEGDGSAYSFSDKVRPALGRILYYQIDIVSVNGAIEHSAPVGVSLPAAKNKLGRD